MTPRPDLRPVVTRPDPAGPALLTVWADGPAPVAVVTLSPARALRLASEILAAVAPAEITSPHDRESLP